MVIVKELRGRPHVCALADGTTFRLLPREEKTIDDSAVSEDMETAVKMGLLLITAETPKSVPAVKEYREEPVVEEPVADAKVTTTKNKKSK